MADNGLTEGSLLHGKRGRVRAETLYKFMLAKPGLDEMRKSG